MGTKDLLLDTAIKDFITKGYEKTSIDEITDTCNITKGAFYYHFKSKDEIFLKGIEIIFTELQEWGQKRIRSSRSIKDLIYSYFDLDDYFSYSKYYDNINSHMYQVLVDMVRRFPELKEKIKKYLFANLSSYKRKIQEAQANGEIRSDINAENLISSIIYLVEGLLFVTALTGNGSVLVEKSNKMASTVWNFIKT